MARLWQVGMKYWHIVLHVGMFIGTLARQNVKLIRFSHVGTKHVGTLTTQARMARENIVSCISEVERIRDDDSIEANL